MESDRLLHRVLQYGVTNPTFTVTNLFNDLALSDDEQAVVKRFTQGCIEGNFFAQVDDSTEGLSLAKIVCVYSAIFKPKDGASQIVDIESVRLPKI